MPAARDYKCEGCEHVFEFFADTYEETRPCPTCGQSASWTPSFNYTSRAAQPFSPVVVHRDASGAIRYPGSASAPVPPGFERVELTSLSEVRRFEAEVNKRENVEIQKFDYNRRRNIDEQIKANREALADRLREFTPRGRNFYDRARAQAEEKRERTHSKAPSGSNFHVEAFSFDSSNREQHRDASNEWGRAGRGK